MVHRHIHGTVVTIYTTEVTETGEGYLSHTYTSQYSDPASGEPRGGKNHFIDTFVALPGGGPWVLQQRVIKSDAYADQPASAQTFSFQDLKGL